MSYIRGVSVGPDSQLIVKMVIIAVYFLKGEI